MSTPVDKFLLDPKITIEEIGDNAPVYSADNRNSFLHYYFSHKGLLDFVVSRISNSWIRDYHNHCAIYPSSSGIFLNAELRDEMLHSTNIIIDNNAIVKNTKFLYGSDIKFEYNNHHYLWFRDDKIYLMQDGNPEQYVTKKDPEGNERKLYFIFKSGTKETFLSELNNLS